MKNLGMVVCVCVSVFMWYHGKFLLSELEVRAVDNLVILSVK